MNISPPEISHMYHQYDFESEIDLNSMNNKLFCTFTTLNEMDSLVEDIQKKYDILYNKIFALYIKSNEEYVITYNVDQGNLNEIPSNMYAIHLWNEGWRRGKLDKNKTEVNLEENEIGISPGQACVFYSKNKFGDKVLGGGWISSTVNNYLST